MNGYGLIILTALLSGYLLNLVATRLNIRSMPVKPPEGFDDLVDESTCARSRTYASDKARVELWASTLELAALLIWWWAGGFNSLDQWVRGLQLGDIGSGLLFISALMLLSNLISTPFSVYSTFVIEERYGFNKTTATTYVMDRIKGLFLFAVLGLPLLAGVLWFFSYAGSKAWLYCWAMTTIFTLLIQYIAPVWLMPLFNRFTPLTDGELKRSILDYTAAVGFGVADIFEVDGSKRSAKANAFFTGFGKNRRIALFDTLIANHSTAELVAVLAHEVGHQKKRHMLQSLLFGIAHMGVVFYLLSFFLAEPELFHTFKMEEMSIYAGLTFFSLLLTPLDLLLGPILKWFSRKNEFEADRFAVQTIPDRSALISALKKLSVDNLANLTPHPFYVMLNYSHPPLMVRIAAINSRAS